MCILVRCVRFSHICSSKNKQKRIQVSECLVFRELNSSSKARLMSVIITQIKLLKTRLEHFTNAFQILEAKLERKSKQIEDLEKELKALKEENKALELKYEKLRVTKSIAQSGENPVKVKHKINELIKGLDKCIHHLSK